MSPCAAVPSAVVVFLSGTIEMSTITTADLAEYQTLTQHPIVASRLVGA
jgi:hypothetical protein